jgi:FkbM family methyltransferase
MLTRDHIVWAYRLLLDRDPESDAAIAPKLAGCHTTQQLRADLVTSQEYRDKNPDFAHSNDRTVVIKEFADGTRLFVDLSDHAIGLPIVRDQYEQAELRFIQQTVRAGDHVIDLGAHIGFFTIQMAALVGPRGSVTAFEPFDDNAQLLARSIRENRYEDRVTLERAAAASRSGRVGLAFATETLNSGGAFVAGEAAVAGHQIREVRAVAIDDVSFKGRISFIKMDVEGAEPLVLQGAARLIARDRPIVLSELHASQLARVSNRSADAFLGELRTMGYGVYRLDGDRRGAELTTAPPEPVCSIIMLPRGSI